MTIGECIRRLRLQRGLTQDELGYLIGNDSAMIRKYESGKVIPKANKLEKIAFALGVHVEVLRRANFDNITAMHSLFQLFRQYGGDFDNNGNLKFQKLDLSSWKKRWEIYREEIDAAEKIEDEQAKQYAIEDAEDKFNWWMDTYPRSDAFNVDFDETLENYRKLKNKRRNKGNT